MARRQIRQLTVSEIYPLLVRKAERKGRTRSEVDTVTRWLTGYDQDGLERQLERGATYEEFFSEAPCMNPRRHLVTGKVCGVDVSTIEDPVEQGARYLDKLVDELARGKALEKVIRS